MELDKLDKENKEYFENQMELEKDIKFLLKKHWNDDLIYQGHQYKLFGEDKFIKIWIRLKQ